MIAKNYYNINWKQAHQKLLTLQYEILKAFQAGDKNLVLKKQYELTRSFAARAIAIRKITSNKGKNTAGIDGIILTTHTQKMEHILKLKNLKNYKTSPVKRIYISKEDGKSKRPLGIPTMFDRAVQTLFLYAIEPIVEEVSCKRAYGFRIGKSLHDCAAYLFLTLASMTATRRFILKADINKFFDSVSHDWLLENIWMDRKFLKLFLKAGFLELNINYGTEVGFPQGSPISPALANLALAGLEKFLGKEFLCTRYADDFVVLGKSRNVLKTIALKKINEFLNIRGLSLNLEKTKIYSVQEGFNFVGLNFREYPDKSRIKGTKLGIFIIKPTKEKINSFIRSLRRIVKFYKNAKTNKQLVIKLNQKLRGFAEHYNRYVVQRVFNFISFKLFRIIYSMLKRKHRGRNATWLYNKYFCKIENTNWVFCHKINDKIKESIFRISYVKIKRHNINTAGNPFDPANYASYKARTKYLTNNIITTSKTKTKLITSQKGICPVCSTSLLNNEELHMHHIKPKRLSGSHKVSNLLLLHKDCHKQVEYSTDVSLQAAFVKDGIIQN